MEPGISATSAGDVDPARPTSPSTGGFYDGELVQLSRAGTQYKLHGEAAIGKATPPMVVCIHGINTAHYQYEQLATDLATAGNYVLTYDLYGRGGSGDPKTDHDLALFVGQLAELIFHVQNVTGRFYKLVLVGMSMGGAIAAAFADTYTSLVEKVVLMAPCGLPATVPLAGMMMKIPLFGEAAAWILKAKPDKLCNMAAQAYSDPENETTAKLIETNSRFIKDQCAHKDCYMKGLLSTLRKFPFTTMKQTFVSLGEKAIPTLLVWGDQDKVVPFENSAVVKELIPHAKLVVLSGCAHADNFGVKYYVMRGAITDFLAGKPIA